jgi:hypothetical protein
MRIIFFLHPPPSTRTHARTHIHAQKFCAALHFAVPEYFFFLFLSCSLFDSFVLHLSVYLAGSNNNNEEHGEDSSFRFALGSPFLCACC